MLKIIIISQLVQSYFNPEFGGIFYYKGQKIIDSAFKYNDMYFEFVMKGAVDPYFLFYGTFPLTLHGIELEESYVKTLTLPVEIILGKFKSRFTRLNQQHTHSWDFPEMPYVYTFLAPEEKENEEHHHETEGINIMGCGISYIFPLEFFLEAGFEIFKGEDDNFNNFIPYMHFSFDFPFYTTFWMAPSFYIKRDSLRWYGIEIVLKRIKPGAERLKGTILTAGYFQDINRNFRGGYADIVYKFTYGWRMGLRSDFIYKDKPEHTFMIDYSPTEFSRFRLSYKLREKKIFFEFNFSVGPHGAHPF